MERKTAIQNFLNVVNKHAKKGKRDLHLVEFDKPTTYTPDKSSVLISAIEPIAFTHISSLKYDYGIGGTPPNERKYIIGKDDAIFKGQYLLNLIKEPTDSTGLSEYAKVSIYEFKKAVGIIAHNKSRDILKDSNLDKKVELYLNHNRKEINIVENKTEGDKFLENILKEV